MAQAQSLESREGQDQNHCLACEVLGSRERRRLQGRWWPGGGREQNGQ